MPTVGLDHAVLVHRSMDEAESLARRLGFLTTPRAVHPFGTGNVLVQFDDHNLEFLAILDADKVDADRPDGFSFARFNRDFLARNGPGLSMIVVKSLDRAADAERFRDAGFVTEPFSFSRAAKAPDGTDAAVSFDLLFAEGPLLSDAGLFTCRHNHTPELYYKPANRHNPNGTVGVAGVLMAALDPGAVAETLAITTGGERRPGPFGERVSFGPDVFDVLAPDMLREALGLSVHVPPSGLRHVGLRLSADPIAVRGSLETGGVPHRAVGDRIVATPDGPSGGVFLFEPSA